MDRDVASESRGAPKWCGKCAGHGNDRAAVKNARTCGQDIVAEGCVGAVTLFRDGLVPLMMLAITHIPVHQQAYLLFGVALRGHPRDEVLMFALIVGGALLAERDYRQ